MNKYTVNIAQAYEVPGFKGHTQYKHYFRIEGLDDAALALKIAAEMQTTYPTAKVTVTRWNTIGTELDID